MKKHLLIFGVLLPFFGFSQDGTLDQTFGTNGLALGEGIYAVKSVKTQTDGKVVTCGTKSDANGTDFFIARYNTNGQLDNTFDTDGIAIIDFSGKTDEALDLGLQADGKIIAAGYAINSNNNSDIAIIRLNSNGSLDNTFGTSGKVTTDIQNSTTDRANKFTILPDGKIVVIGTGGTDIFSQNIIVKYNTDGTLDNTFDTDGKIVAFAFAAFMPSTLTDIKTLDDGKVLISGSSFNKPAICKLNTNGTFDLSFNTTGKLEINESIFGGTIALMSIQTDGKIVLSYGSGTTSEIKFARFQANGSLDPDFGTAGKSSVNIGNGNEYTMAVQVLNNGKIIVSGSTYANTTNTDFFVARLTDKGALDNTFGTNGFTITSVAETEGDRAEGMAIQSDGKIVVAGNRCTGSCKYVLLRYNNSGPASALIEYKNTISANIYPNPATSTLSLIVESNGSAKISINSILGRLVFQENIQQTQHDFNIESLSNGIYFITVETVKGTFTQKFIKQ